MSEFSRFMKANKKVKANQKYAPTAVLQIQTGSRFFGNFARSHHARMRNCAMHVL